MYKKVEVFRRVTFLWNVRIFVRCEKINYLLNKFENKSEQKANCKMYFIITQGNQLPKCLQGNVLLPVSAEFQVNHWQLTYLTGLTRSALSIL